MMDLFKEVSWNKKIEILRVIKGWSQEETANKCNTEQKTFWLWEKGKTYPRKNSRRAIAQAFNIPEVEIFGEPDKCTSTIKKTFE